jgi:hypothetical protein
MGSFVYDEKKVAVFLEMGQAEMANPIIWRCCALPLQHGEVLYTAKT